VHSSAKWKTMWLVNVDVLYIFGVMIKTWVKYSLFHVLRKKKNMYVKKSYVNLFQIRNWNNCYSVVCLASFSFVKKKEEKIPHHAYLTDRFYKKEQFKKRLPNFIEFFFFLFFSFPLCQFCVVIRIFHPLHNGQ